MIFIFFCLCRDVTETYRIVIVYTEMEIDTVLLSKRVYFLAISPFLPQIFVICLILYVCKIQCGGQEMAVIICRLMATTIQVNLVSNSNETWRRQHRFT